MRSGNFFVKLIKVCAWLAFTALVALLYMAFYTGFIDAVSDADVPNILLMPPFMGGFAVVHYAVLLLINRLFYRDNSFCSKFFSVLKKQGGVKGALIILAVVLFGFITCALTALVHLYYTLVVLGICRPKTPSYKYTSSAYTYKPTTLSGSATTAYKPTAASSTSTSSSTAYKPAPKAEPTYNFNSYRSYIQNNLSASSIRVSYGYTKFVRSARVTSLSLSFSSGSTPSISASATVTLSIDNYAVRQYIGVDSHHNSTYANSNVVDGEISSALSSARDSAEREIEDRISSLTRRFASQNGGEPDRVNARVSVSVRKG